MVLTWAPAFVCLVTLCHCFCWFMVISCLQAQQVEVLAISKPLLTLSVCPLQSGVSREVPLCHRPHPE